VLVMRSGWKIHLLPIAARKHCGLAALDIKRYSRPKRRKFSLKLEISSLMPIPTIQPVAPAHLRVRSSARNQANKPSFFIIQARDIFSSIRVPLATAWEDLVVNVSKSNSLAQANFVRIDCPKDIDSNTDLPLKPSFDTCSMFFNPEARPD